MVINALRYMTATDPTALAGQAQAECLQTLEQRRRDEHRRTGPLPRRVYRRAGLL